MIKLLLSLNDVCSHCYELIGVVAGAEEDALQLVASLHSLFKGFARLIIIGSRRGGDKAFIPISEAFAKMIGENLAWYPKGRT